MTVAEHALSVFAMVLAVATIAFAWWRKAPVVMGIVIANFAVFVFTVLGAGSGLWLQGPIAEDLAARVAYLSAEDWPRLYTVFTATFLHADLFHLLGNMLVLILIGLPFEDRVGRRRFILVYFWSAVVAVLLHAVYIHMTGDLQDRQRYLVGASGAVFGILGAFATMHPRDRITMPLGFIILPRVPVFIGALVLMAIEYLAIAGGGLGRVAHAAHFGGAVGGVIAGLLLRTGAKAKAEDRPSALRYDVLERLATTPQQRAWVQKVRENEDHPETSRAWLDRLLSTLRCPQHDLAFQPRGRDRLVCPGGHEERYAE